MKRKFKRKFKKRIEKPYLCYPKKIFSKRTHKFKKRDQGIGGKRCFNYGEKINFSSQYIQYKKNQIKPCCICLQP